MQKELERIIKNAGNPDYFGFILHPFGEDGIEDLHKLKHFVSQLSEDLAEIYADLATLGIWLRAIREEPTYDILFAIREKLDHALYHVGRITYAVMEARREEA